jgi:DNA-binding helix-hairpin-helix protein with protein kinase domain
MAVFQQLKARRGGTVVIGQRLGGGGEGEIYAVGDPSLVAKLYKPECASQQRLDKLQAMLATPLDRATARAAGICWPVDLLVDANGRFRGYLMPKAGGKPLASCVFNREELAKSFPHWDRRHLVRALIRIVDAYGLLHARGILVGDINPNNVLVQDENTVFIVDTDSFQVGRFPCPVGTAHFCAPELQGARFGTLLRTEQHECFAVATLVFMVLMGGKPPYAQVGGESPAENIRNGRFPYPLREHSTGTAPQGAWRFIWSHLAFQLKEALFQTFDASGRHLPRRRAADWSRLLRNYLHALEQGWVSRELFPCSLKRVSAHAKAAFGVRGDQAGRTLTCIGCGQPFLFSSREEAWYRARNLSEPRRCPSCREAARAQRLGLGTGLNGAPAGLGRRVPA